MSDRTTQSQGSSARRYTNSTLVVIVACTVCRQRAEHKHLLPIVPGVIRRAADHELATLRELPSVTVQTTNALYAQKYVSSHQYLL